MMIPDDVIEQVRDAADLVALIGESVELKRTGSDYRGACPFHGGVHRNFAVIPKKGRYYCFVCKESGDVFTWYMKRLGLDYPSAVREVARRFGVPIPEQSGRTGPDPREPLFAAVAVAHDWFTRQLREAPEAEEARKYLLGRGLDLDQLGPYELGYAPRAPVFPAAMEQLGLSGAVMLEAGLLARREDGRVIPRFRGRILFPIHDLRGRVVGFGGRLLGPGEPKYLNSPESTIFRKGGTLYNLHQGKTAIRKEDQALVVEGYFDVLRLLLAGQENVVAPLGTALTAEQAALLRRFTAHVVLLFDSDPAGLRATFRAGDELLRHECRVRVATLPPGEDPDSLVRRSGLEALHAILRDAVDLMERKIRILEQKGWFTDVEHRREALDRLLPTIRATRDPIQRELYLTLVAERTGVDKKVLEQEAAQATAHEAAAGQGHRPEPAAGPVARPVAEPRGDGARAELQLLRLLIASEEWRGRARTAVPEEWFDMPAHREMFAALRLWRGSGPASVAEGLSEPARERWARLLETLSSMTALDPAAQAAVFDGACRALEMRPRFRRLDELNAQLRIAGPGEQEGLLAEQVALARELRRQFPDEFEGRYGWRRLRRRAADRRAPDA